MSIYLRTGQPGHGKSYGAIRVIRDALECGQYVATNIELRDGWARVMARSNVFSRLWPGRVAAKAASYEARCYVTHSLDEFSRMRLPPCRKCDQCRAGGRCRKEGRGRMVLDEAHNWLNSRTWDADESGQSVTKAEAVANRLKIVRLFSQHRKLGWHVDLITQDDANLDRQVRGLFEYHVHLKNLRRFKVLGIFPVVPVNVFVAVTTWHDNDKSRLGVETFLLNKKLARCYDTTATSHGLSMDDPNAILLGDHTAGAPPARRSPRRGLSRGHAGQHTTDSAVTPVGGTVLSSAPDMPPAPSWPPSPPSPTPLPSGPAPTLSVAAVASQTPINAENPVLAAPGFPDISATDPRDASTGAGS